MAVIKERSIARKGAKIVIKTPDVSDAKSMITYLKKTSIETDFLLREPEEFKITLQKEKQILKNMRESEDEVFICAKVDDEIVANLGFFRSTKKRVSHQGRFGIAVLKDYWGMGIGTVLIKEMIDWTKDKGIIKITLEVDEDNERAHELYRKFGFVEEGKLIMDKKMKNGRFKNTILMGRIAYD